MKRFIILLLAILLVLCSCTQTPASGNNDNTDIGTQDSTNTNTANNPIDNEAVADMQYVLPEDVTAEMTSPDYWKADNKILMTSAEISEINSENAPYIKYTDANDMAHLLSIYDIGDSFSGKSLLDILDDFSLPVADESYIDDKKMSEDFVKSLEQNLNKGNIKETISPQFGVCVKRTVLFSFPTNEPFYSEPNDIYYSENIMSEIYAGDGVVILHTSTDGEWSFVLSEFFCGWMQNENFAVCKDKAEWEKAINPEKFLIVTGDKIVIDKVFPAPDTFEEIAYMGMKIKLSDTVKNEVNGRAAFGTYCVEIPSRDESGNFRYIDATIAISQDVSVGYLPISSKAIIEQAYKFLGHTYGWGGTHGVNDCSGIAGQIFRCFGIKLPRNSSQIAGVNGFKKDDFTELDTSARISTLKELPQGSILFFRGHIMIYLGIKDDMPYCLSSSGLYVPKSEKGKNPMTTLTTNCVSVNVMDILRGNGKTWLDSIETVISPCK